MRSTTGSGFAAVGRYNEFENLRTAGIRYADLRGYSYDRTDVTGRGLANAYAQLLGTIFSSGGEKPYEVEIVVAELGPTPETDQIYRLTYDGSVADENGYAVMGGSAEAITETVRRGYQPGMDLAAAVRLAVRSLSTDGGPNVAPRELGASALEVAILDRTRVLPRKFRRIHGSLADRAAGRRPGRVGRRAARSRAGGAAGRPSGGGARDRARAHGGVSTGLPDRPTPAPGSPRVVVIGVGLIGASIGSALTQQGWPVFLRDAKSSHARVAETLGAGSTATPAARRRGPGRGGRAAPRPGDGGPARPWRRTRTPP